MVAAKIGLRERKKQQTRARIADEALRLFAARGFDGTTVAEVAAAADVSVKTVFNYFPAKEDLFFDRSEEVEQRWLDAVADRRPDEPVLAGLRRSLSRFGEHAWAPSTQFRRVMASSAVLQGRAQQMWARHEDAIAEALARDGEMDLLSAQVVAHQVISVHPLALRMIERWSQEGIPDDEVRDRAAELVNRAFDMIEGGLSAR